MNAARARIRFARALARAVRPALPAVAALTVTAAAAPAFGATPLADIRVSPDVPVQLGSLVVGHENIVRDDLHGTLTLGSLGAIPHQADLDAYHRLINGAQLLSFDTTVTLPGGLIARPADVVRYDGVAYTLAFDAAARGIPRGVNVDAVAVRAGALLLSFDVSVDLGGFRVEDEDLVAFDGSGFSLFFDGSAAGIDPRLDLDGAELFECNDHLLLSFDGSGAVGGVAFDDEDVLEYDRASTWQMAYDGSAHDPNWTAADLDAVSATVDFGPGTPVVFGQTVKADTNKTTFRWTTAVAFRAVRGFFSTPHAIGAYTVSFAATGTGTSFVDAVVPAAGSGSWYLVKPAGCGPTSWQTLLGAQPGRDASIP
jgi:hypothetical protein